MNVTFASVCHPKTNNADGTVCRGTNFTLFRLMYGAEAMLPEEVKHQSLQTTTGAPACPSEAEEKDLLESDRLKAVANLQKY
jgi:hypothetical protein